MGSLRKYLFNGAIITALLSGVQSLRAQRRAPKDWRTYLGWTAWGLTTAVAIGTVRINSIEETKPESQRKPKTATGPKIVKKAKK
jgi:hypothetical protein